ncbi:hypothetical protein [Deinococcus humi]|uniref:Putative intracellular protease/amidase n=1 Tax=Deinococcus humi TaxID=662880 RepID=A0A7W8NGX1_9DEIO|nr:hypothetical protein [Deinococcus humi]MBB5365235.1 putative intracellular protease/amidase [Deinococcus humi]
MIAETVWGGAGMGTDQQAPIKTLWVVSVSKGASYLAAPALPHATAASPASPVFDPAKPTVAVVVGHDLTEVADVLAPYAVFQAAGAFNVVPHSTFAQLGAQLRRGPDVIVVPHVPYIEANEALRLWLKRHGQEQSLVLGICAGAAIVAAAGLLDGWPATTHWGDSARIKRSSPAVRWERGER